MKSMGKKQTARPPNNWRLQGIVVVAIVLLTAAVYLQTLRFGFQYYHDDEVYVTNNQPVLDGLSASTLAWAFNVGYAANWHPLTWISHAADCQLFGNGASGHHATSVLLHIANVLLLLMLLKTMTGEFWKSAFVAALFAVHPLHVESVAWISERKDVLSTCFMLLTCLAYVRYTKAPRMGAFITVAVLYVLGLLAKPMLVTLPFILLMLDYWPLCRMKPGEIRQRIIEKLPLIALAVISSVFTFVAQQRGGAVQPLEAYSLSVRVTNALVAYGWYLIKMVWPAHLAALYPHPVGGWEAWKFIGSGIFLLCATILVVRSRRPYAIVGWLWFVVTLLPVIGLVQVGEQAYADRYSYIPLVGIFIILAWAIPDLLRDALPKLALAVAASVIVASLAAAAYVQTRCWSDSVTLFEHAIRVVPNNYVAEHELGMGYARDTRYAEALPHMRKTVDLSPNWHLARFNLACVLYLNGDFQEAADELATAYKRGLDRHDPRVADFTQRIESAAK